MQHRTLKAMAGLVALAVSGFAPAQVRIGGARLTGLAGAGLALPYSAGQVVVNPGLYARRRKTAQLHGPLLDYYAKGLSFSEFQDLYGTIQGGGIDVDNLGELGRKFGRSRKEIGVLGLIGATLGGVFVGYRAEASGSTIPNEELRQWSRESGDPLTLGTTYSGAGLDAFGYAYESVDFGYGLPFRRDNGTLNVGARVRNVSAYYTHFTANASVLQAGSAGAPGPEMGGDDVLKKSGVGMDLGFMYTPREEKSLHFGAVVENLIRPSVGFKEAEPHTAKLKSFNPFNTAISVGTAFVPSKKFEIAADYIDITDSANRSSLRMGAEYHFNDQFALSAGLNTRETWTVGASIFGIYVSFAGDQKLWLGRSLRF